MSENVKKKLPEGWRWVKLGEVCEEKMGLRDPHKQPDTPFYYVDISSVDNNTKQIIDFKEILGKDAPSRARQIICKDDVIVATTRPNLNAVAIVPPHLDNQICSTGFCVLRAKSDLDTQYLFAFVQTKDFIESLSDLVKGALYPAVTDKQVREQMIPLPPLPTQQRLAARLNDQLATVERARLAAQAQLEEAKNLPAAYLRQVFPKVGEVLPEGWRWVKLGEVCHSINYGHTASADYSVKEPKFLRITDIQNGQVDWDLVPGCQITLAEEITNRLTDGDIVFARTGGTTGKSFLIQKPPRGVFASYLIRLTPSKQQADSNYLYLFFQSDDYWRQIKANMRGGAQPNVNATLLSQLQVPLPPLPTQQRLAARLNDQLAAVERLRLAAQAQLNEINALPAALLRKAFNGEL